MFKNTVCIKKSLHWRIDFLHTVLSTCTQTPTPTKNYYKEKVQQDKALLCSTEIAS
jgi:hypothetical protein